MQREHPTLPRVSAPTFIRRVPVARQQLAVEAADQLEYGSGICWVRDDLQDVALQRQDKNASPLHRRHPGPVVVVVMVDSLDIDRETRGLDCTDDPSGSPGPSYAAAPPCLAAVERLTRGASDVQRTLTSCTAAPCLGDHSKRGDRRPRPYALAVDLVLTSARGVAIVQLVQLVHLQGSLLSTVAVGRDQRPA